MKELRVSANNDQDKVVEFKAIAKLDSQIEIEYYRKEGILQFVLRQFLKS